MATFMMYETIFDAGQIGYRQWWFPSIGLAFVFVMAILVFGPEMVRSFPYLWLRRRVSLFINRVCFIFAVLWTSFAFSSTYLEYLQASSALKSGKYSIAVGRITGFSPLLPDRTGEESFEVNGKHFSYSDHDITAGFNEAKRDGNPLKNDLPVRVLYVNDIILRIEIAR